MIITFSGTDGIGKSTQIVNAMKLLKSKGIEFRVQYVREGNTPVIKAFRKATSRGSSMQLVNNIIIRTIGIAISWIELAYYWGVQLRLINKPHRFVLCDRYLWDTYVDLTCKCPKLRETSLLWRILEKIVPTPDASILYIASAEQIAERLRQKEELFSMSEIANALELYDSLQNKFDCIVATSENSNSVFEHTVSLIMNLDQQRNQIESILALYRQSANRQHNTTDE